MSDMGYRNTTQARLALSLNSLDQYLDELSAALTTVDPRYAAIGVCVDGEYRQLNANVLQLENEYYSAIRPKPASKSPRLITALRQAGIEYVEVRTLDLNPFAPAGVAAAQMRFVELLLLYCLLAQSPPLADAEREEIDQRELIVAWEGRRPGVTLPRDGGQVSLRDFALELVGTLGRLAPLLDDERGLYAAALEQADAAVRDPEASLSARVLAELAGGPSFFDWSMALAAGYREQYLSHVFAAGRLDELTLAATESLAAAQALENPDDPPFARFLEEFLGSGLEKRTESTFHDP
jgi:glutamate--cysteine ligase